MNGTQLITLEFKSYQKNCELLADEITRLVKKGDKLLACDKVMNLTDLVYTKSQYWCDGQLVVLSMATEGIYFGDDGSKTGLLFVTVRLFDEKIPEFVTTILERYAPDIALRKVAFGAWK